MPSVIAQSTAMSVMAGTLNNTRTAHRVALHHWQIFSHVLPKKNIASTQVLADAPVSPTALLQRLLITTQSSRV